MLLIQVDCFVKIMHFMLFFPLTFPEIYVELYCQYLNGKDGGIILSGVAKTEREADKMV